MSNQERPDFPADGSDSYIPTDAALVESISKDPETFHSGVQASRAALEGARMAVSTEMSQDQSVGESAEPQEPKKQRKVAFGGFVKPEMYDIFGDYDLSQLSEAEKAWINPAKIGDLLLDPSDKADLVVDRVALNPYEHGFILRTKDPKHLASVAKSRTLGTKDLSDEVVSKSNRAPIHAVESKQEAMEVHVEKLKARRADIKELAKEAKTPGYAHKTPERMKELISGAWQEFTTMLDVMHVQRGWDDEKRNKANAAMINYLTQGSSRERVGHWQQMLQLADGYLGARIHLFSDRINKTDDYLQRQAG